MHATLRRWTGRLLVVVLAMAFPLALQFALPPAWWSLPFLLALIGIGASALHGGMVAGAIAVALAIIAAQAAGAGEGATLVARDVALLVAGAGTLVTLAMGGARRARLQADADRAAMRRQTHERAAVQLRLAASEQRLRAVIDALPDIVFTADHAGVVHLLGRHWLDRDTDVFSLFEVVLAQDAPGLRERWDQAVATGRMLEARCRLRARDAAARWVLVRAQASPAAAIGSDQWFGVIVDIDRQVAAEQALRDANARLALAQQAGRIGMFDWDIAPDRLLCSPTEETLLGLAPATSERRLADLLAAVWPEDRAAVEAALRIAVDHQQTYADEFRIARDAQGEPRWIAAQATIVRDQAGRAQRLTGVHRDVTLERRALGRLEAGEERFRLAAEALDGMIYDHDVLEDRVTWSRGVRDVIGFDAGDVPAAGAWWRALLHPDDGKRVDDAFAAARADRAARLDLSYRVRHRDGQYVHVNDRAHLVWRDSLLVRRVGIVTDVTERRRIERVLRDTDRRKDDFLAVLAHELRNPLAPIRNAVQVVLRARDPQVVAGAAALLERQVSQMVRLIDDLLDVSRIAQGKLRLRREPARLAPIIAAAVETVQPLLDAKRQTLAQALPSIDLTLQADAARLSQVIANLLHNASKYSEPGAAIALDAGLDAAGREIELRVADSGVGIEAGQLEAIFTMFHQRVFAEPAAADRTYHEGLGIGLAIARAVVTLHGGTLSAQSEGPGRGARFVMRLPVQAARTLPPPAGGARCRVLVVDDNRDAAESLASVLRLDQHDVFVAYGGREALRIAEVEHPQVVLLDIGMPDLDGHEVARLLRASEGGQARIVALSGYGQLSDRERSLSAGCDAHLVKPVALADLAAWLAPVD